MKPPESTETHEPSEWVGSAFSLFCSILAVLVIYLFYASEMRVYLENELFDFRTQIKPAFTDTPIKYLDY